MTEMRRHAVKDVIDPRFRYLLNEKEAHNLLLSNNFIDAMLKEAKNDETLHNLDKDAALVA